MYKKLEWILVEDMNKKKYKKIWYLYNELIIYLNFFSAWMMGWLMCKTVPYVQGVSVAASIYSLIAVSLDRYV